MTGFFAADGAAAGGVAQGEGKGSRRDGRSRTYGTGVAVSPARGGGDERKRTEDGAAPRAATARRRRGGAPEKTHCPRRTAVAAKGRFFS